MEPADCAHAEVAATTLLVPPVGVANASMDTEDPSSSLPEAKEMMDLEAAAASTAAATTADNQNTPQGPQNEFDFSRRKVLVMGVPKFYEEKKAVALLEEWRVHLTTIKNTPLEYEKVKKAPSTTFIRVTFTQDSMVEPFLAYVNEEAQVIIKKQPICAKRVEENRQNNKRSRDDDNNGGGKRIKATGPVTVEMLKDKIIPLWKLSAEEQCNMKTKLMIRKCALKISGEIKQKFRQLNRGRKKDRQPLLEPFPWVLGQRPFLVEPLVVAPSPVRNKCELNIDYNEQKQPSAGFMAAGWSGGVSFFADMPHLSKAALQVVHRFNQEFLASMTKFKPFDTRANVGFWRMITIRTSERSGECMIILQHSPPANQELLPGEATTTPEERFVVEKELLIKLLTETPLTTDPRVAVTSIFFQEFHGASVPTANHPVQHAFGKTCLTEQLGACQFQISPGAFFQTNTVGAEALYDIAVRHVKQANAKVLLDVCCGTGTIGLTCLQAGAVERVLGVDMCEPAIADAKRNAVLNGFDESKVRFVAGRAEQVLKQEIRTMNEEEKNSNESSSMVALVDPARDGLHGHVIQTLRRTEQIERLVYISCNPTGTLVRDATLLCLPPSKKYQGRPFRVVSATPVDIFPLTNHCEMVLVLERLTEEDENAKTVSTKKDNCGSSGKAAVGTESTATEGADKKDGNAGTGSESTAAKAGGGSDEKGGAASPDSAAVYNEFSADQAPGAASVAAEPGEGANVKPEAPSS